MVNERTGIDQFMRRQIESIVEEYEEQGSSHVEIKEALKTASKQREGNVGKPEFLFFSDKYLIVVEDKADIEKLVQYKENGEVDLTRPAIIDYALNGAIHYGKHIVNNTNTIKKVFAIGASGDSHSNVIKVTYINEDKVKVLQEVNNLEDLHPDNIEEFYRVAVNDELPKEERELREVKAIASELHEDLRNHGSLEGEKKATVVSAILLALEEKTFNLESLNSEEREGGRDGDLVFNAVQIYLNNSGIVP